jgi:hypothetical protein
MLLQSWLSWLQEGVKQQATPYPTLSNGYLIPAITKIGQVSKQSSKVGVVEEPAVTPALSQCSGLRSPDGGRA